MRKILLIILMFIISSLSVFAVYQEAGNFSGDYIGGRGEFNENLDPLTEVSLKIRNINDGRLVPLVDDLDNDGTNEIVILDDDNIKIYQGNDLIFQTGFDLGAEQRTSNMLLFDIDGDSLTEIIIGQEEDENIFILEYNGTSLNNQTMIDIAPLGAMLGGSNSGEMLLKCGEANKCLMSTTYQYRRGFGGSPLSNYLYVTAFNSTGYGARNTLITGNTLNAFCYPKVRNMEYEDYDLDGTSEFIFSAREMDGTTGDDGDHVYIFYIDINESLGANEDMSYVTITEPSELFDNGNSHFTCEDEKVGATFTNPLVYDLETDIGFETAVGYEYQDERYRIQVIESDGGYDTLFDRYPALLDYGSGRIISNLFRSHTYPDDESKSVCITGFDDSNARITFLCGADNTGKLFEAYEFFWDNPDNYNVSDDYQLYNTISHAVQHSDALTEFEDLNEFMNSYGVFRVDVDNCVDIGFTEIGNCDIERIFQNGVGDSALISDDAESQSLDDLIALSETQLVYLDDGLQNQPATIENINFNPCPTDTIIKQNETMDILVTVKDNNNVFLGFDKVNANITLYKGTHNELTDSAENITVSSETGEAVIQFTFVLNDTGVNREMEIQAYDSFDPSQIDTETILFSVGADGIEYGDINCDIFTGVPVDDEEVERVLNESYTLTDNQLVDTAEEMSNIAGIPILLFILLIMLGMNFVVLIALWQIPYVALGVIIVVDFFIILITALMGLMGTALLVSLFALFIIAGGFFVTFAYNKGNWG